jgi:hypothetical protein
MSVHRTSGPASGPAENQLLTLLRLWWKEGKRRGLMLPHGWLFPGRGCTDPISTRQINRAIHEAAEAAGIRKRVSPHTRASATTPVVPIGLSPLGESQAAVSQGADAVAIRLQGRCYFPLSTTKLILPFTRYIVIWLFSTTHSAFLIQKDLMPCSVCDASLIASRQASSKLFGDWAITSMLLTIDMLCLLNRVEVDC